MNRRRLIKEEEEKDMFYISFLCPVAMDGSVDVEYLVGTSPDESMALRMAETLPDVVDVLTAEAGIVR
jgi:hypothetical protein